MKKKPLFSIVLHFNFWWWLAARPPPRRHHHLCKFTPLLPRTSTVSSCPRPPSPFPRPPLCCILHSRAWPHAHNSHAPSLSSAHCSLTLLPPLTRPHQPRPPPLPLPPPLPYAQPPPRPHSFSPFTSHAASLSSPPPLPPPLHPPLPLHQPPNETPSPPFLPLPWPLPHHRATTAQHHQLPPPPNPTTISPPQNFVGFFWPLAWSYGDHGLAVGAYLKNLV
jgi:hypothetical protein